MNNIHHFIKQDSETALFFKSNQLDTTHGHYQELKREMRTPVYLSAMKNVVYSNEREEEESFSGFSDVGMMYYFVHKPTHIDEKKNRGEETIEEYLRDLLQFFQTMKENEAFIRQDVKQFQEGELFKNLKRRHMEMYEEWLRQVPVRKKIGYGVATQARKVTVLKGFLKWLKDVGYIEESLHDGFLSNTVRNSDRPDRSLSYGEVQQILAFYEDQPINYALLHVLATTGARVREIAQAKWKDLYSEYNHEKGQVQYFLRVIGKNDKPRDLLIFPKTLKSMQEFRRRRRLNTEMDLTDATPLFTTKNGSAYHYKYLSVYVKKLIQQTELPFLTYKSSDVSPHHFRHFFAQYSAKQGAPLFYIQQTLGHESFRTTEIYLDKTLKRENNAAHYWVGSLF